MKTRELGRTGIRVSPYCLGTTMFAQAGKTDHDDRARIVHRAPDLTHTSPRRRPAGERAAA